jgi:Spy/CpxP family protein refolding chaperone
MMKKWLIIVLLFSVAVNVAALVTIGIQWSRHLGRHHPLSRPPFSEKHREMLHRRLDLSEDQIQKVTEAQEQMVKEMETMRMTLRSKRRELAHLLKEPEPNRAEIDSLLVEISAVQADLERRVVDVLLNLRGLLTPEQREKFLALIDRHLHDDKGPMEPGRRGKRGSFRPE